MSVYVQNRCSHEKHYYIVYKQVLKRAGGYVKWKDVPVAWAYASFHPNGFIIVLCKWKTCVLSFETLEISNIFIQGLVNQPCIWKLWLRRANYNLKSFF